MSEIWKEIYEEREINKPLAGIFTDTAVQGLGGPTVTIIGDPSTCWFLLSLVNECWTYKSMRVELEWIFN
jgi:hypothetical protein